MPSRADYFIDNYIDRSQTGQCSPYTLHFQASIQVNPVSSASLIALKLVGLHPDRLQFDGLPIVDTSSDDSFFAVYAIFPHGFLL